MPCQQDEQAGYDPERKSNHGSTLAYYSSHKGRFPVLTIIVGELVPLDFGNLSSPNDGIHDQCANNDDEEQSRNPVPFALKLLSCLDRFIFKSSSRDQHNT